MSEPGSDPSAERGDRESATFPSESPLRGHRDAAVEHDAANHLAHLYETRDEQFATAIPFVRAGVNQDERCLYIAADNTEAEVVTALNEAGIDVEDVRESGQLTIHTAADTYLRTGSFDADDMLAFWESALETAYDDDYTGLRAATEMTWALESDTDHDVLTAYENRLNTLFSDDEYAILCQYDRNCVPADVLSDVVDAHPSLVHDDTVANNVYYVPPDENAGQPSASETLDRRLRTSVERARAESRLERREQGLRALNGATQELLCADYDEIVDRAAPLARSVLDVEFTSFWPYNEDTGELEFESSSSTIETDVTALADLYEEGAWATFVTEQMETRNDIKPTPDLSECGTPLRSGVIVPLGRHGVFCAGSTRPDVFDDATADLATTVGKNVELALDRADHERTLETKNTQLERLRRINRTIRGIDDALVEADTRAEVGQTVCDLLAGADAYHSAWIGGYDAATGEVVARANAGVATSYLDDVTITIDDTETGRGPVGTAIRTRTVQVVDDVLIDAAFRPWREETLDQGIRSCISIPLQYEDSLYGVLTVYAAEPNAVDEREQSVLTELGGMIAHTIDAIETRQSLQTDTVIELDLQVPDAGTVLCQVAERAGCVVEFEGLVHGSDGPQVYFTTVGAPAEDVREACDELQDLTAVQLVTNRENGAMAADGSEDECLFDATVTGSILASVFVEEKARVRSLTTTGTETTVSVTLPSTADVSSFVESVRAEYPRTGLVSRRTREQSIKTQWEFLAGIEDELSDRQRETLRTAYLSGFFESPRARTGEEVAETLDVSQPTFTHHLRAAQRRLCEIVFDDADPER